MIGIYKITNPIGKVYVGQSIDINKRFRTYKWQAPSNNNRINVSLKQYGYDAHKFEVLEECSIEALNERERFYQDKYDVIGDMGLNCMLTELHHTSIRAYNKAVKECSIQTIRDSITLLLKQGIKPSQRKIANHSGLSIQTIKRHWQVIKQTALEQPSKRVSDTVVKVTPERPSTSSSFNRLKQRRVIGEQPKSILHTIPALQKLLDKL